LARIPQELTTEDDQKHGQLAEEGQTFELEAWSFALSRRA